MFLKPIYSFIKSKVSRFLWQAQFAIFTKNIIKQFIYQRSLISSLAVGTEQSRANLKRFSQSAILLFSFVGSNLSTSGRAGTACCSTTLVCTCCAVISWEICVCCCWMICISCSLVGGLLTHPEINNRINKQLLYHPNINSADL